MPVKSKREPNAQEEQDKQDSHYNHSYHQGWKDSHNVHYGVQDE